MSATEPQQTPAREGWLLGIDTSSEIASLALAPLGGAAVDGAEISWEAGRNQTATLLLEVDHLLRLCNIESDALSGIVVATGPGGFNSLRVGMSVAKGLAFAHGIPVAGVGTLDVAVRTVASWKLPIRAFVQAGRGRVVFADYREIGGHLQQVDEMQHRAPADLAADLTTPTVLSGDLSPADEAALRGQPHVVLPDAGLRRRRAAVMIDMALPRLLAGETDDLTTLEPLYLHQQRRETQAAG